MREEYLDWSQSKTFLVMYHMLQKSLCITELEVE